MHGSEVTKLEKIAALNADLKAGRFIIGVDLGTEPATTVSATRCARCSHTFTSRPDGFVDEALENEIAAHQERCVIVGDTVRYDHCSVIGTIAKSVGPYFILTVTESDAAVRNIWPPGSSVQPHRDSVRRTPRPQQGEAVGVSAPCCETYRAGYACSCSKWTDKPKAPVIETPWIRLDDAQPPDPLEYAYDGVTLRKLLEMDERRRREVVVGAIISPAQRTAVSAHWSAQLRAKLAASAEAERNQVRVELQDDLEGEPW